MKYLIGFFVISGIILMPHLFPEQSPSFLSFLGPFIYIPGMFITVCLGVKTGPCPTNLLMNLSVTFSILFYFLIYVICLKIYSKYKSKK